MQDSTRLSVMTDSIGLELVLIESSTFVTAYDCLEMTQVHEIAANSKNDLLSSK